MNRHQVHLGVRIREHPENLVREGLADRMSFAFTIDFSLPLPETNVVGGRSGYECFTKPGEDGNCLFLAAQWFPRLAVYSDYEGWHNAQFLGAGEFTLEFGDYDVSITAPSGTACSPAASPLSSSRV